MPWWKVCTLPSSFVNNVPNCFVKAMVFQSQSMYKHIHPSTDLGLDCTHSAVIHKQLFIRPCSIHLKLYHISNPLFSCFRSTARWRRRRMIKLNHCFFSLFEFEYLALWTGDIRIGGVSICANARVRIESICSVMDRVCSWASFSHSPDRVLTRNECYLTGTVKQFELVHGLCVHSACVPMLSTGLGVVNFEMISFHCNSPTLLFVNACNLWCL